MKAVVLIASFTFLLSWFASGCLALSDQNSTPAASATEAMYRAEARSAQTKFHHIESNGATPNPDQTPTVLTEREINAYVSSGNVKLPNGVSQLRLAGTAGTVAANALVDFDKITEGKRTSNPLLNIFAGVHRVEVASHAQASGGQAHVHIDSVSLDGIAVPRMALEYFARKYVTPRYPTLGLDSTFGLPDRVDTATVGDHNLSITQK